MTEADRAARFQTLHKLSGQAPPAPRRLATEVGKTPRPPKSRKGKRLADPPRKPGRAGRIFMFLILFLLAAAMVWGAVYMAMTAARGTLWYELYADGAEPEENRYVLHVHTGDKITVSCYLDGKEAGGLSRLQNAIQFDNAFFALEDRQKVTAASGCKVTVSEGDAWDYSGVYLTAPDGYSFTGELTRLGSLELTVTGKSGESLIENFDYAARRISPLPYWTRAVDLLVVIDEDTWEVSFLDSEGDPLPELGQVVSGGEAVTLPDTPEIRVGYVFKGWGIDGDTGVYQPGDSYAPTGNVVFQPLWVWENIGVRLMERLEAGERLTPEETGVSRWLNTYEHMAYLDSGAAREIRPNDPITRGELAKALYRLLIFPDVPRRISFSDVPETDPRAAAVETLAELGFISGYVDGSFQPDQEVTRAELAAILSRFAYPLEDSTAFSDIYEGYWATEAIATVTGYGWMTGYADGNFGLNDVVTRAEAALILNKLLGRGADVDYITEHREELERFPDLQDQGIWYYYDVMEAATPHTFLPASGWETWTGLLSVG